MAGTKAGGQKAAAKNLAKDPDFYRKMGAKGGRNGHTGGFACNPELARIAGAKGGKISQLHKNKEGIKRVTIIIPEPIERSTFKRFFERFGWR